MWVGRGVAPIALVDVSELDVDAGEEPDALEGVAQKVAILGVAGQELGVHLGARWLVATIETYYCHPERLGMSGLARRAAAKLVKVKEKSINFKSAFTSRRASTIVYVGNVAYRQTAPGRRAN